MRPRRLVAPSAEALVCVLVLGVAPVLGCTDEAGPGGAGGMAGEGGGGGGGGTGGTGNSGGA